MRVRLRSREKYRTNMKYRRVFIDAFGYELPPNVIASEDLEMRLGPLYRKLRLQVGQLAAITGIYERRFWDAGYPMYKGAVAAGKKALERSRVGPEAIDMLVYAGVCRDNLEPATACAVADGLKLGAHVEIYDVSNACLGVVNGMVQAANAIELRHARAAMVVSCESARQIVELTIQRLLENPDMEHFKKHIATLTGGSGAAAVILTAASISDSGHRFSGGVIRNAVVHHRLCRWGPDTGIPSSSPQVMETDSVGVLKHGVELGIETYRIFCRLMEWSGDKPDKIICHQVGSAHQKTILESIGISPEKDFSTYPHLGNIGTVSLPITAAIAEERQFLKKNDRVGFFGIGSGLNCLMLGIEW
jgi:3-oxoacyl-[acyl-carrier-protein] synthase-3